MRHAAGMGDHAGARRGALSTAPDADTVKLACILHRLELHSDLKSDFLGNEIDPDGVRAQPRFYVAGGS